MIDRYNWNDPMRKELRYTDDEDRDQVTLEGRRSRGQRLKIPPVAFSLSSRQNHEFLLCECKLAIQGK